MIDRIHRALGALNDSDLEFPSVKWMNDIISYFEEGCTVGVAGGKSPEWFINYFKNDVEIEIKFIVIDDRNVDVSSPHSNTGELLRKINGKFPVTSAESIWKLGQVNCPLDLLILGFGEDGHIASIFPNVQNKEKVKHGCAFRTKYTCGEPKVVRFSLDMDTLLSSRKAILVVSSPEKEVYLKKILRDKKTELPVVQLIEQHDNLIIRKTY